MSTLTASSHSSASTSSRKGLRVALWSVQILLGLAFGMAGFMKSTTPIAELGQKMPWVNEVPDWLVRFIGVSELAGGLGLILPSATRIKPALTPLAALGLVTVMVFAAGFHLSRGEAGLPINVVLGALAAFVAWGRWKAAPIAPRG